jgi:hypothetical protein
MPAPTRTKSLINFSGGLNLRGSEVALKPWESPDLLNVEPSKSGGVDRSKGYTRYNGTQIAAGAACRGLYDYVISGGTSYRLVVFGTGLYRVATDGTVTTINASAFSGSTSKVSFETFNDVCIICTGDEVPVTYDGSSVGSLTGVATLEANVYAKYAAVYKNRLFLSGNSNKPYRVYYGEPGKHNDWSTGSGAGSFDVNVNDGQIIRQIKSFPEALIVFKDKSIHYLSGDTAPGASVSNPFRLQLATSAVGTTSPNSVVVVGSDMYFWGNGRITTLKAVQDYGNIHAKDISFNVQPLVKLANASAMSEVFAVHHELKSQIWFMFPNGSSSQSDTCLIYDYAIEKPDQTYGSWWLRDGFKASCGIFYGGFPLFGGYDGWLYKHDNGNHYLSTAGASTAIHAYFKTYWETFGSPTNTKRIRSIDLIIGAQTASDLTLEGAWDYRAPTKTFSINEVAAGTTYVYGATGVLYGTAYYASSQDKKITRIIADIGNGKALSLKIGNNSVDAPFSLLGYEIDHQGRGIRYGSSESWY